MSTGERKKRVILYSLIFVTIITGYALAQAAANFSGTWVLDTGKSDLGMDTPAGKNPINL